MIKKISAIVLALMLCLSVVVMPANASGITLGGDDKVAFLLEWDKAAYNPGDTAVLSVYLDVADDLAIESGAITIGLNSAVISQADNAIADVKANATVCELFASYFKDPTANIAWLNTTIAGRVNGANTTEEKALYDHYIKLGMSKNTTSGTHANAGSNNDGLYGSEIDSTSPLYTLTFKISDSVQNGTAVKAAITTGTLTMPSATAPSTYIKTYTAPGSGTGKANVAATSTNITKADTTVANGGTDVTIGAATIVNPLKGQMRYDTKDSLYDVRALAEIKGADFVANFGADGSKIVDIGFVFTAGSNVSKDAISMDTVKNIVEKDGTAEHYTKKPVKYISTSISEGNYVFSCIVENIDATTAASAETLVAVAYVEYTDADGKTAYAYYDGAQEISYSALYNSNNNTHK